jgi:hypothetical protein
MNAFGILGCMALGAGIVMVWLIVGYLSIRLICSLWQAETIGDMAKLKLYWKRPLDTDGQKIAFSIGTLFGGFTIALFVLYAIVFAVIFMFLLAGEVFADVGERIGPR